jgi:hypothetical protein
VAHGQQESGVHALLLVLVVLAAVAYAVGAAPATAEAATCGTLRVAPTGHVTILPALAGAQEAAPTAPTCR